MLSEPFVVIDFETTGLSPERGDRITEVGAVRLLGGKITDRYQSLANCGVKVPGFITSYTGITQRMVDRAPAVEKVICDLLDFIGGMQVVAHNASFDQRFLDSECGHSRRQVSYESFVCSMRVSRRVYPAFSSHALAALAEQLGVSYRGSAHRALADAEVTANVMTRIGRDLAARHKNLQIDAQLLHQVMKMPVAKAAAKLQRLSLANV